MSHTGFLDPPAPLTGASSTVFWIFASATFLRVAGSLVVGIGETVRRRSVLPLVVLFSATLWLPNEPFIDTALGFQYAGDAPGTMFTLAGRVIPLTVLGVGAMFTIFPWLVYRLIEGGASRGRIIAICVVAGLIDWPLEWMAIHWNVFEYYGDNPSRILGLPLTSMVQNCFLYAFMGSVLALCAPYLRGWRALLFLPVIPGCYYAVAFLCTWPHYIALHAGWPAGVFWPLTLVAAAANAYVPLALLGIVTERRAAQAADAREAPAGRAAVAARPAEVVA
jgi:hypothetical protein